MESVTDQVWKRLVAYARKVLGGYADLYAEEAVQRTLVKELRRAEVTGKPVRRMYLPLKRVCQDIIRSERARRGREKRYAEAQEETVLSKQEWPAVNAEFNRYTVWLLSSNGYSMSEIATMFRRTVADVERQLINMKEDPNGETRIH